MENWVDLAVLGGQLETIGLLAPCLDDGEGSMLSVTDLPRRAQVADIFCL